jgi:hypothetical protein
MRYSTSYRNFLSGVDLAFHNAYSFTHRHLFHSKYIYPSFSLLQGKHLPFSPSPLRFNIFRLFVILSLTQLYRYTPKKFLFSTATIKYTYRAPLRRIGQEYSANVSWSTFQSSVRVRRPYLINFCIVSFVMEMYLLLG